LFEPLIWSERHLLPQVIGHLRRTTCDRQRRIGVLQTAHSMNTAPRAVRAKAAAATAFSVRMNTRPIDIDRAASPF
jgi:hypothetical protein